MAITGRVSRTTSLTADSVMARVRLGRKVGNVDTCTTADDARMDANTAGVGPGSVVMADTADQVTHTDTQTHTRTQIHICAHTATHGHAIQPPSHSTNSPQPPRKPTPRLHDYTTTRQRHAPHPLNTQHVRMHVVYAPATDADTICSAADVASLWLDPDPLAPLVPLAL